MTTRTLHTSLLVLAMVIFVAGLALDLVILSRIG